MREAWQTLGSDMPPPVRLALLLLVVVWLATKVCVPLVRFVGGVLRRGSTPVLALLTYPEFACTTLCRRMGWRFMPGTYVYGRGLRAIANAGTRLREWVQKALTKTPKYPWKATLVVAGVLVGCWYIAPQLPEGAPRSTITHVNDNVVLVDAWIASVAVTA